MLSPCNYIALLRPPIMSITRIAFFYNPRLKCLSYFFQLLVHIFRTIHFKQHSQHAVEYSSSFLYCFVLFFCVELLISLICYYSSTTILYRHSYPSTIVTKPCSVKAPVWSFLVFIYCCIYLFYLIFTHDSPPCVWAELNVFFYEYDDLPPPPLTSTHKQEMIMFLI